MLASRHRLYLYAAALIMLGCLVLVFVHHNTSSQLVSAAVSGCIVGTMFGQTTLAAAWATFGPTPLIWRHPLSLIWVLLLMAAWTINRELHGGPERVAGILGLCLLGQWLFVQLALWTAAKGYGVRLQHQDEANQLNSRKWQFGVRQLMMFIAMVGVFVGTGRIVATSLVASFGPRMYYMREWLTYSFLVVAAIAITLPLLIAALIPRRSGLATLLILVLIGAATIWEVQLLRLFGRIGPTTLHFAWINSVTVFWILAFAWVMRTCGYRLATVKQKRPESLEPAPLQRHNN